MKKILTILAGVLALAATSCVKETLTTFDPSKATAPVLNSYNEEEDEQNVHWIAEELGAEILRIETDPAWNVTETDAGYHFYPHKTRGEGFFLSALRKTEEEPACKRKKKKEAKVALPPSTKELTNWLTEPVKLTAHNDVVYAIPAWADKTSS